MYSIPGLGSENLYNLDQWKKQKCFHKDIMEEELIDMKISSWNGQWNKNSLSSLIE